MMTKSLLSLSALRALGLVAVAGTVTGCQNNDRMSMGETQTWDSKTSGYGDGYESWDSHSGRASVMSSSPGYRSADKQTGDGYEGWNTDSSSARTTTDAEARQRATADTRPTMDSKHNNTNKADASNAKRSDNRNPAVSPDTMALNPDNRILSFIHAKNLEEIAIGELAQSRGTTQEVRRYGEMLVRDHKDADKKVMDVARAINVELMTPEEVADAMREKNKDGSAVKPDKAADPVAALRELQGSEFDAAIAEKMHAGHTEVISKLQSKRDLAVDNRVRDLIDQLLPTLRKHETEAKNLHTR